MLHWARFHPGCWFPFRFSLKVFWFNGESIAVWSDWSRFKVWLYQLLALWPSATYCPFHFSEPLLAPFVKKDLGSLPCNRWWEQEDTLWINMESREGEDVDLGLFRFSTNWCSIQTGNILSGTDLTGISQVPSFRNLSLLSHLLKKKLTSRVSKYILEVKIMNDKNDWTTIVGAISKIPVDLFQSLLVNILRLWWSIHLTIYPSDFFLKSLSILVIEYFRILA